MVEQNKLTNEKKNSIAIGVGVAVGATLGFFALPMVLAGIGLTAVGPVAGGIFAGLQAGGSVTAGSVWALGQSIAMGGSALAAGGITTGAVVGLGALGGGVAGFLTKKIDDTNISELEDLIAQLETANPDDANLKAMY